MNFQRFAGLISLCFVLLTGTSLAAVPDDVIRDFKPLSGYVIMPVQGEFLIDQDATKGVSVGDLFSVVKPGEKIVHPVTKEVLGTLDEVKGLLQVTRVKSGYAYAKPLGGAKGVERGDVVRRFENVTATFWDYTGQGEAFSAELSAGLPNLAWTDYAAAQAGRPQVPAAPAKGGSDLIFILRNDGLEVRDAAFQALHAYPAPVLNGAVSVAPGAVPVPVPAPVPVAAMPGNLEARIQALEQQAATQQELPSGTAAPYSLEGNGTPARGVAYEAAFPGFINVGNLPKVTTMADFVRSGGRTLMAETDGMEIRVFAVDEGIETLAAGDTSYVSQILSVRWWQPQPEGELFLVATCWQEPRLESALFALRGAKLVSIKEDIPYTLGSFDLDRDGRPELLLGQSFDRSTFFGSTIRELRLKGGDDLEEYPVPLSLPPKFMVQGSLFADLTGDGTAEAIFVANGMLHVYAGDKEIYKSPRQMGGTLSVATFETNPDARHSVPGYAEFDVVPVAVDLDGDGQLELLSVAADRSFVSSPGIGPSVKKSWLAVIKYREKMFVKGTLGEALEVPLQGLTVADGRVLFVASEPANLLGQGGASHLLAFPLAK